MGKKNKAFKLKEYKVPEEKYVVVVNPWGLPERFDNNTRLNEIGVWFQFLLKRDYPDARVREIFYQKTHRNIIVVLPREIDITKYLGGYKYSQFHKSSIPPEDTRSVFIYEYRYSKFGNPGKTNWTGIVPSNEHIPAGLLQVLKDPFPFPTPAPLPPSDIGYARPIPQETQNILATVGLITSTPASENKGKGKSREFSPPSPPAPPPAPNVGSSCSFTGNQASTSTGSLFTPYEPPSHYRAHVETSKGRIDQQEQVAHKPPQVKMDPYEEEEVEKGLLRLLSPVKNEESNEATDFLNSFLSTSQEKSMIFPSKSISRTASTFDDDGDYKPSPELLNLFNTLPDGLSSTARNDVVVKSEILDTVLRYDADSSQASGDREDVIVKSEVVKTEMIPSPDEEYRPSDELLAAFANLTDAAGYGGPSIKLETEGSVTERLELRVKEEPTEIQLRERRFPSSHSDRKQLPKPSTLRTTIEIPPPLAPDNSSYNSNVQVKPEPVDDSKVFFSSNRHFPVPRDRQRSIFPPSNDGNFQSSRDPRKRPMSSIFPIGNERNLEAEEEESGKRLKMEH